jgi:hypothetical protein
MLGSPHHASSAAGRGAGIVLALLAGLGAHLAGVLYAGFALTAGQFIVEMAPFCVVTLASWSVAAAIEIHARLTTPGGPSRAGRSGRVLAPPRLPG